MEVTINNLPTWIFTAVYASPHEASRRSFWQQMNAFSEQNSQPWLGVFSFRSETGPDRSSSVRSSVRTFGEFGLQSGPVDRTDEPKWFFFQK